jgi:hypothetical protein
MKTRGSLALLTGMILLLAACTCTSEPDPGLTLSGSLVGVWVFEGETDEGAKIYSRAPALSGDRDGFEFGEHGGLKVRAAGWCGTPQISWANLEGIWDQVDGRVLEIRHAWRGAPREYQLEIISLSPRRLTCRQRNDDGS